jgi:hypothetical protein
MKTFEEAVEDLIEKSVHEGWNYAKYQREYQDLREYFDEVQIETETDVWLSQEEEDQREAREYQDDLDFWENREQYGILW